MPYLTDSGNAEALIEKYGDELCYCPEFKSWMKWTGRKWVEDSNDSVFNMAKDVARSYATMAEDPALDAKTRAKYLRHSLASESLRGLQATITLAKTIDDICVSSSIFDRDPMLLNVDNGMMDLDSGEFKRYDRAEFCTKCAPVVYNKGKRSPVWEKFVADVIPNPDTRLFVQRAVGYSLTGRMDADALFILQGDGRNGKTTFVSTILNMLGDYGAQASPDTLIHTKSNGPRDDVFVLRGRRFVSASETEESARLNEAMVKQMTGGDRVSVNPKYRSQIEFYPTWKVWLSTNHEPLIKGNDPAIWRRIIKIPFNEVMVGARCNPKLKPFLLNDYSERSGILNWALEGLEAWKETGLNPPESILRCTKEYRMGQDLVGQFLIDRCRITHNRNDLIPKRDLYRDYLDYAKTNFEHPMSMKVFCSHIKKHEIADFRDSTSRFWVGISRQTNVCLNPATFD